MSIEYHHRELAIALDSSDPARAMPPILPKYKRILDVGCGMGQSLLAAHLPSDVEAYGVDCDMEAIEAGRRIAPPNIKLTCARGEELSLRGWVFRPCVFTSSTSLHENKTRHCRNSRASLRMVGMLVGASSRINVFLQGQARGAARQP